MSDIELRPDDREAVLPTEAGAVLPAFPPELLARFARKYAPIRDKTAFNATDVIAALDGRFTGRLLAHESMARHTSIKIGGPADLLCFPKTPADLAVLVSVAHEQALAWQVLGAGSNTLVKDGGIRGIVIAMGEMPAECRILEETPAGMRIEVDAGCSLHALVRFTGKHGLAGMAHLAGIPASVGGALVMNAGVPAGAIGDHLVSIKVMIAKAAERPLRVISRSALNLGYRKTELPAGSIVLSGIFSLTRHAPEVVTAAIAATLDGRREKQPLSYPNLGSIFMNPHDESPKKGQRSGAGTTAEKLPTAGALIEDAGLKGVRVGGARISPKHANFIINEGGATAADMLILMRLIKDKVNDLTGISLKPEIRIIGEDKTV